jgi:hypothetical protein
LELREWSVGRKPPFREENGSRAIAVSSRYQATTSEDTASWKNLQIVEISDGVVIKYNYELCAEVANKSNIQSKTTSRVTLIYVTM